MSVREASPVDPALVSDEEASLISTVLIEVAKSEGWEFDLWYHDASVWLLRKYDADERILRIVQLSLWMLDGQRELEIVPNVLLKSADGTGRYESYLPEIRRRQGMKSERLGKWLTIKAQKAVHALPVLPEALDGLRLKLRDVAHYAEAVQINELESFEPTSQSNSR